MIQISRTKTKQYIIVTVAKNHRVNNNTEPLKRMSSVRKNIFSTMKAWGTKVVLVQDNTGKESRVLRFTSNCNGVRKITPVPHVKPEKAYQSK